MRSKQTYPEDCSNTPSLYQVTVAAGFAVTLHSNVPFLSMTMVMFLGGGSDVHFGGTAKKKMTRSEIAFT